MKMGYLAYFLKSSGQIPVMISFINTPKTRPATFTFGHQQVGPYYWVGNAKNGIDYYAGQTFNTPVAGTLKKVKLYSSIVSGNVNATLSIYEFDVTNNSWKKKIGESKILITKGLEKQWIDFDMKGVIVNKNANYGFKLTCEGGMVAIAECPWTTKNPYADGIEWVGSSYLKDGKFQEDFDFAFEGEIETLTNPKFI